MERVGTNWDFGKLRAVDIVGENSPDTNLDREFAELIEVTWACERAWNREDRIDAAIKYGRL